MPTVRTVRRLIPIGLLIGYGLFGWPLSLSAQSGSCDPSTPFYAVDLTADPAASWSSPLDNRDGLCCGNSFPDRCVEFEITLHPDAMGLEFDITTGAVPSGSLFYQIDCGAPIPVGDPICLPDAGPHTLTFCKPGANPNAYTITSIPAGLQSPQDTVKPGCSAQMVYSGFNLFEDSIVWQDITSGTGYYNAFLDCVAGCDSVTFSPPTGVSAPWVDFQVCGVPNTGVCSGNFGPACDTFRMIIIPPVEVAIVPTPPVLCAYDSALTLHAQLAAPLPGVVYRWTDGPDGTGAVLGTGDSLVITGPGTYSVVALDTLWPACSRDTATVTVSRAPPVPLTVPPDADICAGESVPLAASGVPAYAWSPAAGLSCVACPSPVATPSADMTYQVVGTDAFGCTDTGLVRVRVHDAWAGDENISLCAGDSVFAGGAWQSASGTYVDVLATVHGCDSVRTVHLTVSPDGTQILPYTICPGGSVLLPNGVLATGAGTWADTISSTGTCHQVLLYAVSVRTAWNVPVFETVCQGDSVRLPDGQWTATAGTYVDTLATADGCDSVITTTVQVLPAYLLEQTRSLCAGDSLLLPGGGWATVPGVYADTLGSNGDCHEIVRTTVVALSRHDLSRNVVLCAGDSVALPDGSWASAAGTYVSALSTWQGCDSVITTSVSLGLPFRDTTYTSLCPGDSASLPGLGWVRYPGNYTVSGLTAAGCDSVMVHAVTWRPVHADTVTLTLCAGDSVSLPGHGWASAPATVAVTWTNAFGCDSSVRYRLLEAPAYRRTDTLTACPGQTVALPNGYSVSVPGTYVDTFASVDGCDSVLQTTLLARPAYADTVTVSLCAGEGHLLPGGTVATAAGWYADTLVTAGGCDSLMHTRILLTPAVRDTVLHRLCPGDSVALPDGGLAGAALAADYVLTAASGCDSLVHVRITMAPRHEMTRTVSLCNGDSVRTAGGLWVIAPGTWTDTLANTWGCDSVVHTVVDVFATWRDTVSVQICIGDSYTLPGGGTVSAGGFYTDSLVTTAGCDSVIVTDLYVGPILYTYPEVMLCAGDSLLLPGGAWASATGSYVDTLVSTFGCDSIISTAVTVLPPLANAWSATLCAGDYYALPDGSFASATGVYAVTLPASSGCDSVITVSLTVRPPAGDTLATRLCPADSVPMPGGGWTASPGVFDATLPAAGGCDSTVRLIVLPAWTGVTHRTLQFCPGDSVVLPDGDWTDTAGLFVDTVANVWGCDSILRTLVTANTAWTDTVAYALCPGESAPLPDGTSTALPGVYADTLPTGGACDSVFVTVVDILPAYRATDTLDLCPGDSVWLDPFGWCSAPGTYTDLRHTVAGCDSVSETVLRFGSAAYRLETFALCGGDSVRLDDGSWTNTPGTWTFTHPSATGCDSVIEQHVGVDGAWIGNTSVTVCAPDSAWLPGHGWATGSGTYSVFATGADGCDSVMRYHVAVLPAVGSTVTRTACTGDSVVLVDGTWATAPGTYVNSIPGTGPCPATVTTVFDWVGTVSWGQALETCQGSPVLLPDGSWVDSSGIWVDSLTTAGGCDSVVTTVLTVWPDLTVYATERICAGDTFALPGGGVATMAGTYVDTLSAHGDCAVVIRTELQVTPPDSTWLDLSLCAGDSVVLPDGSQTAAPGTYTFTLAGSDACDSVVVARVAEGPPAETLVDTVICHGDSVFAGGAWQTASGTFVDSLVSPEGCPIVVRTTLTVVEEVVLPPDATVCPGDSVFLAFTGPGPYAWTPETGLSCPQCPATWVRTTTSITYTVTHPDCPDGWTSTEVTVTVLPPPVVSAGPDRTVPEGTPVTLQAVGTGNGALTFQWSDTERILCSDCPRWSVTASGEAPYTVLLEDAMGCRAVDTVWIRVEAPACPVEGLEVPNALSPNGDQRNDAFHIRIGEPERFREVRVFNRWGEVLFRSEDPGFTWDGTFRGRLVDPGVYPYYLTLTCPDGEERFVVGNVTLLR